MANGYIISKGGVQTFLNELKRILKEPNVELIIDPREENDDEYYSTEYCLTELGYQDKDVIQKLLELKVTDYIESCKDERFPKSNEFNIFGIILNQKEIYIKVKVSSYTNKIILCMSFHYAKFPLKWVKWK